MNSTEVQARTAAAPTTTTRVIIGVVVAIVISLIICTVIALIASALTPHGTRTGLELVSYGPLATVGIIAGTVGWAIIRRSARRPRAILRVLVPVVAVLSLIPDLLLLFAGNTVINVISLMIMHLLVATTIALTLIRVLPVADKES